MEREFSPYIVHSDKLIAEVKQVMNPIDLKPPKISAVLDLEDTPSPATKKAERLRHKASTILNTNQCHAAAILQETVAIQSLSELRVIQVLSRHKSFIRIV